MERNMRHPAIVVFSLLLSSLFFAGTSAAPKHHPQQSYNNQEPKHFVLVHGAFVGAWSWYKMIPLLHSYGHNVTAMDLAASGINLTPLNHIRSFSDYSKPLIDFMESLPSTERVILVGHSFGGAAISQAMELFPHKISVAVFLTASMPGPSLPPSVILQKVIGRLVSSFDNKLIYDDGPDKPPTRMIIGPNYLSRVTYQYSPPEDAALAITLVRSRRITTGKELVFSETKYGSVKRVFIISEDDQVYTKQFQEWMIEKNPPNHVETIKGSDHMVMTSQPAQLLARLLDIARNFS